MKYKKLYSVILTLTIVFSGCSFNKQTSPQEETVPETVPIIITEPAKPTPAPTEAPTEPTEPDLSLHIEPGSHFSRFSDEITGDYLDYYLFIPLNAEINMPLVVFLHGDGEVGRPETLENYSMIAQARAIYGEEFPFVAISPCTRTKSWIDGSIPQTLKGLIDATVSEYSIDPTRIIITGHSRGATGVWNMIGTYGDYFSAAVPVSCPHQGYLDIKNCAKVAVWAFAGTADEFERYCQAPMRQNIEKINEISDISKFTILEGCNHSQTKDEAFSEETFQWMLSQNKE